MPCLRVAKLPGTALERNYVLDNLIIPKKFDICIASY